MPDTESDRLKHSSVINGYDRVHSRLAPAVILLSVVFNLVFLYPEVAIPVPNLNDNVMHLSLVERASETLSSRESTFDPWVSYWVMGFPVFHYYQHLPHIAVAAIHFLTLERIDLFTLFNWTKYLLLAFFPLPVFFGLRMMAFPKSAAAFSAFCSSLLSTHNLYGFDFGSYVWAGTGLFTQLWGMFLLPLCIGQVYSTMKEGKEFFRSVLLFVVTLLSHVLYVYIAAVSLLVLALVQGGRAALGKILGRLLLVFALSGAVSSYFLIPYFVNLSYLNRSVWEAADKYDSYGSEWVTRNLVNGDLLDYSRFPILTLLMFIGLAAALVERREHHRIALSIFILWLLLYFGRPTWGILLNLLPMSADIHFHRFIGGVHLGAIALVGIGIQALWDGVKALIPKARQGRFAEAGAVVVLLAVLVPVYRERIVYLDNNKLLLQRNAEAFKREDRHVGELMDVLRTLEKRSAARIYAGLPASWGASFTVGDVPIYAILSANQLDTLGYAYHAMSFTADIQYNFNENDPAHYDLFNVGYVVAPASRPMPAFLTRLTTVGNWAVYASQTPGYFAVVRSDVAVYGSKGGMYRTSSSWLSSPLSSAKEYPSIFFKKDGGEYSKRLEMGTAGLAWPSLDELPREAGNGQILSQNVERQVYSASVRVQKPAFLLFKMTYHPYWRTVVDGVEKQAVMLAPGFTGLYLQPGEHRVRFEYRPPVYKYLLLAFGLVVLIGTMLLDRNDKLFQRSVS